MCDPLTITAAVGTAVTAAASIAGGVVQHQAAKENAKVAQQSANYEADLQRERARKLMGAQRAAYAAAGVDPGSGSPLDVGADTAASTKLDELAIRWGGSSRAAALKGQGQQALLGGFANAGSSILSGATSWGADLLKPSTTTVPSYSSLAQRGV